MKKTTIRLIILCLVLLFPISTYFLIDHLYNNSMINSLEKYKIRDDERIINEFTYDNNNYLITMYYEEKQTYSNVNILLKQFFQAKDMMKMLNGKKKGGFGGFGGMKLPF